MKENSRPLSRLKHFLLDPIDSDDPSSFDRGLIRTLLKPVETLSRLYFRAEVRGLDRLPKGAAVVVGNHNAGITFIEPFLMGAAYYRERKDDTPLYFLAHDFIVDLPVLRNVLCRLGTVRASYDSANRVFKAGGKLVVYPGGNREAFRPFSDRHQIDLAGRTGFLKLALRAGLPLVPNVQIGGHETFFILSSGKRIAKLFNLNKMVRSETFPLIVGLPWGIFAGPMFHLPLPSKSVIAFGYPLDLKKMGYGPETADDNDKLNELYELVSSRMQEMMNDLASERKYPILG